MITGPKAAPKMPQAFSTKVIMVPLEGLAAMSSATTEMASTTSRPAQSISRSELFPLRIIGLYTSLAKAAEAARSWESAVLMAAARMALSSRPERMLSQGPEKIARTMEMKTVELS